MPRLSLSLLGSFQATLDGRPITGFESDRVRALLAYLAVESDRPHRRDKLVGLLWPDWPEPSASTNLRNALSNLRKAVGDREAAAPALLVDRETIQFNPAGDAWVDVHAFDALTRTEQPARWEEGLALYRGPFLEGFSLKDSAEFEEWVAATREQLERRCLAALTRLAEQHEGGGDLAKACEVTWRAVDLAPWQEESHRRLLRLLALSGQRSAALTQYETCRSVLKRELGVEPAAETTRLYEQIRDGVLTSGGTGDARASALLPFRPPTSPLNLPTWLTPFVGREELLAEIATRLADPGCRLLTLVGPGGSGKTRLAVAAAAGLADTFPQGMHFAALAAVQAPDGIVPAIGQALGFTFREREDPHQQLLGYLRAKTLLLILDNCEHLLSHAETPCSDGSNVAAVACDIVKAAPGVKLLVTSRAGLNVEGEQLLPMAGMGLPEGSQTSLAEALESSAVQLFVQTAQRVQPTFRLTDDNLAHVIAICRQVAGLPLGIVLAAAWLRLLSPAEIVAELEGQGLDFLETDRGDAPERQRSLRAAFDYSWRLLSQREREALAGLSIFRSGATYTATHEVTGATLRDLRGLINASLLERTPAGRYVLHDLLRQYAEEKLNATADGGQAVRDRHATYYAAALARWTPEIKGSRQSDALAEMEIEISNIHTAWHRAIERGQLDRCYEGIEGLGLFYLRWPRYDEGEAAFRPLIDALAADDPAQPTGRKKLLAVTLAFQAAFGTWTGRLEQVARLARRSRVLLEETALAGEDVRREQALAWWLLGMPLWSVGDVEGALVVENGSIDLYRALKDRWGTARALAGLGDTVHYIGDYESAIRCRQESMEICRALGAIDAATAEQARLGMSLFMSGRIQEAEALQVEAIATWRELRQPAQLSDALYYLAKTLRGLGRYAESLAALEECVALAGEQGKTIRLAFALKDLGAVNMRMGRYDQSRAYLRRSAEFFRGIEQAPMLATVTQPLGEVVLYEHKPAEAYRILAENLLTLRQLNYHAFIGWTTAALAIAALELGRRDEAREKLSEALRLGVTRHDLSTVLCTLAGAALLLAAEEDRARAVELYTLVARYPICGDSPQLKLYAGERMPAIIAGLPADVVVAAQARGQAADPFAAAEALLAEWGG